MDTQDASIPETTNLHNTHESNSQLDTSVAGIMHLTLYFW